MGKIKLNLVSGAIVEKPLLCAFKANNFEYIVLDNEMNGSMGLPIILVCKLENGKLIKIADQNEWQIVKEYLKNIIAGSQVELIKVASEMPADDIYYTQLTLPLPSFDALKSAYTIEDEVTATPVAPEVTPSIMPTTPEPSVSAPENIQTPSSFESPTPISMPTPPVSEQASVEVEATPVDMSAPAIDLSAPIPTFEEKTEEVKEESEAPSGDNVFQAQKEAFMQACENMFDALVQKFERELENHK